MSVHLQFLLLGLGTGTAIALLGLGLVLEFRSSGVINFAHGALAMFVAYSYVELQDSGHLVLPTVIGPHELPVGTGPVGPWTAAAMALAYAALLGAIAYFLIFKHIQQRPALAKLVAAVALTLYLQSTVVLNLGTDAFGVSIQSGSSLLPRDPVNVLGTTIPADRLWLAAITVVCTAALSAAFRFTRFGLATRAAAETEEGVAVLGYSATALGACNWIIATMLAGAAGILIAPIAGLNQAIFVLLVVPALGAALVGKLSSFWVTLVAGLVLGMLQSEITKLQIDHDWLPQYGLKEGVPFIAIILALVILGNRLPLRGSLREPRPPRSSRPRNLGRLMAVGTFATCTALYTLPSTYRLGVIQSELTLLLLLSVVLLTGYCGQISLAQMACAGAGGFCVSITSESWGIPFPLTLLLGGAAAAVLGLFVGLPALRSRGLHLAVLTLAVAVAFDNFFFANPDISGGLEGRQVPTPTLFGIDLGVRGATATAYPKPIYGVTVLLVILVVIWMIANVRRSATGRHMLAVRAREGAASASGIHVGGTKLFAFACSGFVAGVAGGLIGYQNSAVSQEQFGVFASLSVMSLAYVGGVGRMSGAVFAAVMFAPSGIWFVSINEAIPGFGDYAVIIGAIGVIGTTIFNPDGIAAVWAGGLNALESSIGRSKRRARGQEVPNRDGHAVDPRYGEPATDGFLVVATGLLALPWWSRRAYTQVRDETGPGSGRMTGIALAGLAPIGLALGIVLGVAFGGGIGWAIGLIVAMVGALPIQFVLGRAINMVRTSRALEPFSAPLPAYALPLLGPGIWVGRAQAALNGCWVRPAASPGAGAPSGPSDADDSWRYPPPAVAGAVAPPPTRRIGDPLLTVDDLSVVFGGVAALHDVSLVVRSGQIVGLIGPNGAGKTTTVDAVTGFTRPTSGRMAFGGSDLSGLSPSHRNRLGMGRTFQALELFDDLTVEENLLVAGERRSTVGRLLDLVAPSRTGEGTRAAEAALEQLHLGPIRDRLAGELSTAQRRRVTIGRALATRPSLLLLDEPAAGLDAVEGEHLGDLLRRLAADGTAILVIDHDVGLMFDVCDHIYVLNFGALIASGSPEEIRRNDDVVRAYLGDTTSSDTPTGAASRARAFEPTATEAPV